MIDSIRVLFRNDRARDCAAIFLCAAVTVALLRPFQNTPYVDDFLYGWSVEWFLKHRELKILELSTSVNVFQILWGALFCLPFGFSFTALRVSTWVLSIAGLCGLYLTLRELGVSRRDSLIGTALLGFYPVYFLLSFTFMTDVPFIATVIWFCYALIRATRMRSDRWLVAAVALAGIACGIRLLGVALPIVMIIVLLFHEKEWGIKKARFLLPVIPLLFIAFLLWWLPSHTQVTADVTWVKNSPANRVQNMKLYALGILPQMLVVDTTFAVAAIGVALAPLILGCFTQQHLRRWAKCLAVVGVAFAAQAAMHRGFVIPLKAGALWSFREIGMTTDLVSGHTDENWATWWTWTWNIVTLVLGSATLSLLVHRKRSTGEGSLYWLLIGQFLLIAVLWLFYDRIALPLVAIALLLILGGNAITRPRAAAVAVGLLAVLSLVGVRDHLAFNGALWKAVAVLQESGATNAEISGAYPIDGWLQYAHPEAAPRDADGKISVPWVTSKTNLRYEVSTQPIPGCRVLKTIPYRMYLKGSGSIYISEHPPGDQGNGD